MLCHVHVWLGRIRSVLLSIASVHTGSVGYQIRVYKVAVFFLQGTHGVENREQLSNRRFYVPLSSVQFAASRHKEL